MPNRSSKKSRDTNILAKRIVDVATGDVSVESERDTVDSNKNPAAVALGRLGGQKGGKARATKLTPKQRSEIAKRAAAVRWAKKR